MFGIGRSQGWDLVSSQRVLLVLEKSLLEHYIVLPPLLSMLCLVFTFTAYSLCSQLVAINLFVPTIPYMGRCKNVKFKNLIQILMG